MATHKRCSGWFDGRLQSKPIHSLELLQEIISATVSRHGSSSPMISGECDWVSCGLRAVCIRPDYISVISGLHRIYQATVLIGAASQTNQLHQVSSGPWSAAQIGKLATLSDTKPYPDHVCTACGREVLRSQMEAPTLLRPREHSRSPLNALPRTLGCALTRHHMFLSAHGVADGSGQRLGRLSDRK